MKVVTFYSYKGGVGRTLACANFGLYTARTGKKVVLMDMDFEAPGLDSKFEELKGVGAHRGVVDQLYAFSCNQEVPPIEAFDLALPEDVSREGGRLWLIPAGGHWRPDYFRKLSALNWEALVDDERGLAFCLDLVRRIEEEYKADLLIIDSRTGLTEVGGLATQVLPDTVILLTSMSNESIQGTRHIFQRISTSPIVARRGGDRTSVDLRVVVTRVPRPDDLPAFERLVRRRLDLDVDRLYYLFDQRDLSFGDYLALERFSSEPPALLADYIELFASLTPESNHDFIERRLESLRRGLTQRSPAQNEQLVQELLTLFPVAEVLLEAARYYRLRNQHERALTCYVKCFKLAEPDDRKLAELAEVCKEESLRTLEPRTEVAALLRKSGIERMSARLLQRYFDLLDSEELRREVVSAIEADESKITDGEYRTVLFGVLRSLGDWTRIIDLATADDERTRAVGLIVTEAHAALGEVEEVKRLLTLRPVEKPRELEDVLRILYRAMPVSEPAEILRFLTTSTNVDRHYLEMMLSTRRFRPLMEEYDAEFGSWMKGLYRYFQSRELAH
jgi:tetratricopeptide (TPR) repeat protein